MQNQVPFRLPPLAIQLKDNNPGVEDAYLRDEWYKQTIRGRTLLMKDSPTREDVAETIKNKSVIRDCFVPWKFVNLNAMLAFFALQKCATMMTQNTLPAVSVRDATGSKRKATVQGTKESSSSTEKTASPEKEEYESDTKIVSWNYSRVHFSKSIADETKDIIKFQGVDTQTYSTYPSVNDAATFVKSGGVFFPFVPDLSRQDSDGPISFITHFLFNILGSSIEECRRNLELIRAGWGVLSKTDVGNQIAHFYRCYGLSLEGQAQFVPLFTFNYYEGAIVMGEAFEIVVPGNSARPRSKESLIAELRDVDSHARSILKITEIFNSSQTGQPSIIADALTSIGIIRKKVLSLPLTQDQIEKVRLLCYRLRFTDEWSVNLTSLTNFLSYIRSGELPESAPVSPAAIDENDIGKAALSCFGRMCPSFIIPSGRTLDLRKPIPVQKMQTVIVKKGKKQKEMPFDEQEQTVQVRLCNWASACVDLDRVRSQGEITVVTGQTARAGNIRVFRGQQRSDLWSALVGVVHNSQPTKQDSSLVQDVGGSLFGESSTKQRDEIAETTLFL